MISESSEESSGSDQELLPAEPSPPQDKTNKSSTIRKYKDKLGYNYIFCSYKGQKKRRIAL